jgi:hypothetical protein
MEYEQHVVAFRIQGRGNPQGMMRRSAQTAAARSRRALPRAGFWRSGCSRRALLAVGLLCPAASAGAQGYDPVYTQSQSISTAPSAFASGLAPLGLTGTALEESVQRRPRPEFQAIGMQLDDAITEVGQLLTERKDRDYRPRHERTGSFQVYPKIEGTLEFTDNLYRRETNKVADQIVKIAPSVLVQSEWANHMLYFNTGALSARHVDTASENYLNWFVGTGGRLDIEEDEYLNGNLRFAREHEQRGSADDVGLPEPTPYANYTGDLAYTRRGSSIYNRVAYTFNRYDYDDVGTTNNDDRDRNEHELAWRIGWEDVPGMVYYVEPSVNTRIYDQERDDNGLQRSSHGWRLLAGINWDVSGVSYAEAGVGYMSQYYDDASLDTIAGWSVNGKYVWNTTELVTMTAEAQRSINETTQVGASGILATRLGFTIDYEAFYNVILDAKLVWRNDEYEGINRSDDIWGISFGTRYLISENYYGLLRLSHDERESNQRNSGYTDNRIILTLGAQI